MKIEFYCPNWEKIPTLIELMCCKKPLEDGFVVGETYLVFPVIEYPEHKDVPEVLAFSSSCGWASVPLDCFRPLPDSLDDY